jgi:hypothetical protein
MPFDRSAAIGTDRALDADVREAGEEALRGSGVAEPTTAKQRASVQREVDRLLELLAPERSLTRAGTTVPAVQRYRAPRRCVLQSKNHAVSVSWFPPSSSDDKLGEVQVIEWRGVVSLPGSSRRAAEGAVAVKESLLQPVELGGDVWVWQASAGGSPIGTSELVAYCERLVEKWIREAEAL